VLGVWSFGWLPSTWRSDRARLLTTTTWVKLALAVPVIVVAIVDGVTPGRPITDILIALLAVSMGIQNATVRRLAVADLATNVITTSVTGLVADLHERGWRESANAFRLASVLALFVGALVGAVMVLQVGPGAALALGAVLLALVGMAAARGIRSRSAWTAFGGP
jgi:uncharacterized membrane protein YoaK (UPF0700 family)